MSDKTKLRTHQTRVISNEDFEKYEKIVVKNKSKQKNTWVGGQSKNEEKVFLELNQKSKETVFIGYNKTKTESKLLHIILNGKIVNYVEKKQSDIILVFDRTPFYAEAGGQVGDSGNIFNQENDLIGKITDTKKIDNDIYLHFLTNNIFIINIANNATHHTTISVTITTLLTAKTMTSTITADSCMPIVFFVFSGYWAAELRRTARHGRVGDVW